jgi:PAS domain S-box-containing protein
MDDHNLLQRIVDILPQAIFWKDADSRYLGCNVYFAQLAGCESPADIVGKTDYDLSRFDEAERFRRIDRSVIESGRPILEKEEIHHQKDGKTAYLMTSKVPLYDEYNRAVGVLGTYADISNLKNIQRELLESREKLNRINEQLTEELDRAAAIQEQLLPLQGFECSFLKIDLLKCPLERITGDYYSFRHELSDVYSFIGADIAGHGIAAALFTSLLKVTCQRVPESVRKSPAAFCKYLDKHLEGEIPQGFFTAILMTFTRNPDKSVDLVYCNAAHPPLIHYNASTHTWAYMEEGDFAVGIFNDIDRNDKTARFFKGDRVFFYTDGFIECDNNNGELLGREGLKAFFNGTEAYPIEESKRMVMEKLSSVNGGYMIQDDLTLVGFEIL